jgi:predicted nucleic acid-binding protein
MAKKKKLEAHLFIDTNILLGFFAYTKDDLDQLEKLVSLIQAESIKLYLTKQVVDEFYRNRESKLAESLSKFRLQTDKGCPSFMQSLEEYKVYMKALAIFEKSHGILLGKAKEHAENRTLLADDLFSKLASEANVIEITDEAYNAAIRRSKLGNPPGKGDSIGDELNWELLLGVVQENSDLHVISKDGDYASKLNPAMAKSFLIDEWAQKNGGQLHLYAQIGQFFEAKFPGEDFLLQAEKRDAIEGLIYSGSFAHTHAAIVVIDAYIPFFTNDEAEEVIQGCLSNSQIAWIVSDTDVQDFLTKMLVKFGDSLSDALRKRLKEALGILEAEPPESEEQETEAAPSDDDIPF